MTIPTNETHGFDDWWCLLVTIANQPGMRVKPGPSTNPVWKELYDAGMTPGAAYLKAVKLKRIK